MARPLRIEYPGAFYHVTSRGNEQKDVFKSQRDREKFLEYLESATERYGAVVHAYCLMSNHYHLLLETPAGNLSQMMRHINGAYTTYFNIKRKRSGHLFQGRYKAILVEFDEYALELTRYIHLNPVRVGMVTRPEEYRWSSYKNYIGQSAAPTWLKLETILAYFGKKTKEAMKKYRSFVEDLLGEEYDSPFKNTFGAAVLGTAEFREMVTSEHLAAKEIDRAVPGIRQFKTSPEPEEIVKAVGAVMGGNQKLARQVGMYLCHKYSGKKLRDIGNLFGVGETAIAEARRLLTRKLEVDKQLCGEVEKVKANLRI
jgi:REP-associated tyrosine transposase